MRPVNKGILLVAALIVVACFLGDSLAVSRNGHGLYPPDTSSLSRKQCMQCHPIIAHLLMTRGAAHKRVACRQCHLKFHVYVPGKTNYHDILPKCSRCHNHPHGEELTNCSSCHTEAHTPLDIPATLSLAQGCHVCHPEYDKDIKTFTTKHTEFHCTACHHTRHGYIPECLECHQPHRGIFPVAAAHQKKESRLDRCTSCHPPHKALNVTYSDDTPNRVCGLCHRKALEMLKASNTKHSRLRCTRCHPDKHKTIKRCRQCHGQPHPFAMFKRFGSCGKCHGVAHSIVK